MDKVFSVVIIYDDGSEEMSSRFQDFDQAVTHTLHLADQRLTPFAEAPLMKTIHLFDGAALFLPIKVVRVLERR